MILEASVVREFVPIVPIFFATTRAATRPRAAGRAFSFVSKGGAGGPFDHVLLVASALADREFALSRIERTEGGRRETTTFGDGTGDIRSRSTPARP